VEGGPPEAARRWQQGLVAVEEGYSPDGGVNPAAVAALCQRQREQGVAPPAGDRWYLVGLQLAEGQELSVWAGIQVADQLGPE